VNVEIATSQLPRIVRLALIGAATAFAWIVVSLLLGLGLGQAHADDTDGGGLLGGAVDAVTATVDTTATTATNTVSTVTTAATEATGAGAAVVPTPVQQPVSQVAQTAGGVVTGVTQPVSDVVSGGVVSGVTQPLVDVVSEVPVVGGIVTGVGLDDAAADLSGTVDDSLGGLVGAVDDTGATIGQPSAGGPGEGPPVPGLPGIPALLTSSGDAATTPVASTTSTATEAEASAAHFSLAAALRNAWVAASHSLAAGVSAVIASSTTLVMGGLAAIAGGLCLPTSSAGPGGAGPGAWALAALLPLVVHRAWVRRAGPEDEHAPPAPAGSTDVSPD
jgi:hypothetical protein